MTLNEVKVGDIVTYKNKQGKQVKGKVIHRHDGKDASHLTGHVNIQKMGGAPSFPVTIHVSDIKPFITEDTSMINETHDLVNSIVTGNNIAAEENFNAILQAKINDVIADKKIEVASSMFNAHEEAEQVVDEALIGGQKKLDKNHNNKLDGQDFKMLRAKKGVKEDADETDDVITEVGDTKLINKDKKDAYVKSLGKKTFNTTTPVRPAWKKHPNFLAVGRKALRGEPGPVRAEEYVDEADAHSYVGGIDKIGKHSQPGDNTMRKVRKNVPLMNRVDATRKASMHAGLAKGAEMSLAKDPTDAGDRSKNIARTSGNAATRFARIAKGKAPFQKEEVQLDEISPEMAQRYLQKKRERDYNISADGTTQTSKKPQSLDRLDKNMKGTIRALNKVNFGKSSYNTSSKMKKEEVQLGEENIQELSPATHKSYQAKATTSRIGHSYRYKNARTDDQENYHWKKFSKRYKGVKNSEYLMKKKESSLDELNQQTYFNAADKRNNQAKAVGEIGHSGIAPQKKLQDKAYKLNAWGRQSERNKEINNIKKSLSPATKRAAGVRESIEEKVQQLDEISKKTLRNYVKKKKEVVKKSKYDYDKAKMNTIAHVKSPHSEFKTATEKETKAFNAHDRHAGKLASARKKIIAGSKRDMPKITVNPTMKGMKSS